MFNFECLILDGGGKGRPRIEEDWGRCFAATCTRRSKGGGASAVGGGRRSETDDVECLMLDFEFWMGDGGGGGNVKL